MRPEILELAADLARRGEPFVLATVVWRRAPSSGQEGATALISGDGRVRGWLGGACAELTVVREALLALEEGTPRLLFLGTPEELEGHRREGVVTVPIACQSEGAMEVYVEPVLSSPQLVAIGRSPAATTLVKMAAALGWRAVLVDDGADASHHPDIGRVVTSLSELPDVAADDRTFVVVATQGHYDEDALQAALATPAAYVGLVASARRAEATLGYLRDRGVSDAAIARVHAPAGLDLGHIATEEIAVAILADIVRARAAGELASGDARSHVDRHEAVDPVCGMTVDVAGARYRTTHEGRTYFFCSAGCLKQFEASPAAFASATAG